MTLKALAATAFLSLTTATAGLAATIDGLIPENGIDYHFFDFAGGSLSINAPAQPGSLQDSMSIEFALFLDDGSSIGGLTGSLITLQDDGNFTSATGNFFSSMTAAGAYVLAVGVNQLQEAEARSGIASTPNADDTFPAPYSITYGAGVTVNSVQDSTGQIDSLTPVPLPATLPLLAFGLGGIGYLGSRRRKSKKRAA
jgi:hypothetical protein